MKGIANYGCCGMRTAKDNSVLVVDHPIALRRLLVLGSKFDEIQFVLREESARILDDSREAIIKLHQECGCVAGQVAMSASAAIAVIFTGWSWWNSATPPTFRQVAPWLVSIVVATLAAKLITIGIARIRLQRLVAQLLQSIASH